jgi:hypothetical protein
MAWHWLTILLKVRWSMNCDPRRCHCTRREVWVILVGIVAYGTEYSACFMSPFCSPEAVAMQQCLLSFAADVDEPNDRLPSQET